MPPHRLSPAGVLVVAHLGLGGDLVAARVHPLTGRTSGAQGTLFRLAPGGRSGCPRGVPGGGRRPLVPFP
jgi:hypothetical protein